MNRISVAIVLAVQLVFLWSCDKELNGSDEKVAVMFAAGNGDYEEGDGMVRSFGTKKPETKAISLGDDLYLYATLRPDPAGASGEVRAAVPPGEGQKVCLAAYNGSTLVGSTVTYTYSGGQLSPDGGTPLMVEPGTYDFVAYSYYNSGTSPAISGIDPATDLVWGRQLNRTIGTSAADRTVTIKMDHLFSKVRMKIKVSSIIGATITALSGVVIEDGHRADLSVHNGSLSQGTALTQTLTWPTLSVNEVTSSTRLVYPVASPEKVKVKIGGMTIRISSTNHLFANLPIEFDGSLDGGTSYLLELNLNRTSWAGSNIYWDDVAKKLTFDVSHANTHYQGVFFKWGSLVGISPAGTYSTSVATATLYIPTNFSTKTWDGTKTIGSAGLPWTSNWESIPHTTTGTETSTSENYLYNNADFSNYKGDICHYIDNAWRLPNADEFGSNADYNPITFTPGPSSTTDPTGKASMGDAGVKYNSAAGPVFFPASGFRYFSMGTMDYVGTDAYYWAGGVGSYSSYYVEETGQAMFFTNYSNMGNLRTSDVCPRSHGNPVRCIKR